MIQALRSRTRASAALEGRPDVAETPAGCSGSIGEEDVPCAQTLCPDLVIPPLAR